jgi:hypothetical protein
LTEIFGSRRYRAVPVESDPETIASAQPDAAGMLADWFSEWRGSATTDDKDRRRAGDLMDWINQSGFVLRATPAPADPDRPSRETVLAAVDALESAAYVAGDNLSIPGVDLNQICAKAKADLIALIERLTPEAGAAAGEGDPYFQHEDDPSYIDGDNPLCPG